MEDKITTVLITGCAGLIGSNFTHWIAANHPEIKIIGIDDLSGGYKENIHPSVRFVQANLAGQYNLIDGVFDVHRPDIVFHFAAYAAEALSPFIRRYNYTNNLVATAGLVNNCIKYKVNRLVFTSTMAVYGRGVPPFTESMRRNPIDPYGVAKAACEQDIEIAGEQHGLDWCIIRPHNVYGPRQCIWDSYRNVLGIWMYKTLNNQPLTIYGDGLQTRSFSYIDDSLPGLWRAGIDPNCSKQIINLGGIHDTTIIDAAKTLLDVVQRGDLEFLPARHEVKNAYSTWQKSVELLGFEHKTNLFDGLTKMWEWVQTQPTRSRMVWSKYELDKGIYDYWKQDNLRGNSSTVKYL